MTTKARDYWNSEAANGHKQKAYGFGTNPEVRYPQYEIRRERVLEVLARRDAGRLLDAGCGSADVLIELLDRGWDGDGIDFAPNMVKAARQTLTEKGYEPARVREGSITDLSAWPDKSFDVVICLGVLGYLPIEEQPKVYAEVRRVLKDKGLFLVQHVNALFDVFTMNRFTVDFYQRELLPLFFPAAEVEELTPRIAELLANPTAPETGSRLASVRDTLRMTTEIPFAYAEKALSFGFRETDQVFMRMHAVPPLLFKRFPELECRAIEREAELCRHWAARLFSAGFLSVLVKAGQE